MRSKPLLYRQFLSRLATSIFSTNSSRVPRSQRSRLNVIETIEPKILLNGVGQDISIQAGQIISGVVWDDTNGDGLRDEGELPVVGATVFIDENLNGIYNTGEPTAETDDQGDYQFTEIAPGDYFLLQILPVGYLQTFPSLNSNSIQSGVAGTDEFIGPLPPVEPPGSDGPDYADNRVIIKRAAEQVGSAIAETAFLDIMADSGVVQSESLLLPGLEVWELPAGSVDDFIAQYAHDPRFEFVERDYIVSTTEVETTDTLPNDPSFGTLWGLHNTGQSSGTVDADIDAPEAWDLTTGSSDVIIGVIDTGINYNHVDLVNNIWTNPGEIAGNGIDDDNNGFIDDVHGYDFVNNDGNPMDDEGHGTHVAGTIAAQGNNGTGVTGVTWNAQLMAIKFLDRNGEGFLSDAVSAINYATRMGAHITNNSWGGGGFSSSLQAAISAAGNAGQLFVAAAGNDGASQADYPALYSNSNILSVASSDRNDLKSSFSNYNSVSVDLAAPGSSIYSTSYTGGYTTKSGTSMATPHVAGAAALLKSLRPTATVSEIKSTLMNTVDPLSAFTGRVVTGGRLNVFNAVKAFYVVPGSHHVIVEDGIDVPDINFGRQEYIPVYDFGDAPDSYGTTLATSGPQHELIGDLYLGTSIDDEADGIPSPDADGDNLDGTDDEDGVLVTSPLVLNEMATFSVTTSARGELAYWIDWDQSGTFDNATERYTFSALTAGTHKLSVPV
ncbi:MAG: S8 family serine peptidase, partial [Planctomycetaceae bacterium]|nr:S8 family serine peptidase [Planctomycetaceae bacterium]